MLNDSDAATVLALEPIFHRSPPGSGREVFEAMTVPDYVEVGASGAVYSRELCVEVVTGRYASGEEPDDSAWQVVDGRVREVGDGLALVTYELHQGRRVSRRSTLWRRGAAGWQALYHQGTLAG